MSIKTVFGKVVFNLKKHSPSILTGVGVVGLGATAYLAYKSRDKVEAVVQEIERKNDLEIPVNKMEVARDIAEAIYLPVIVGTVSITSILAAHKIQNNRIKALAGALLVEQARNAYFEKKYRKQHGEEAYSKFVTPVEEVERVEIDEKGKEKVTKEQIKQESDKSVGQWYIDSSEYVSDDHTYNMQYIQSMSDRLETILFQRGSLTLNEVLDNLGFERLRNGALLGWTTRDSFSIDTHVSKHPDEETGEMKEQIWVTWSRPRFVYDEIEFNGRYSHN